MNVALVCLTGNSRSALQDAITSAGHTYDDVDEADLGTLDPDPYDVLVVGLTTRASHSTFASQIRPLIDGGLPLLLSLPDGTGGDEVAQLGLPTSLGLVDATAGTQRLDQASFSASANVEILDNTHAITTGFSIGLVQVNASAARQRAPRANFTGTKLADAQGSGFSGPDLSDKGGLIVIEAGTLDQNSDAVGARVVMCSWLFAASTAYHANGKTLIANALEWLGEDEDELPADSDLEAPAVEVVGEGDTFFTIHLSNVIPLGVSTCANRQFTSAAG